MEPNSENHPAAKEIGTETVEAWVRAYAETGEVGKIDPEVLKSSLEACGANFNTIEDETLQKKLSAYSNAGKAVAMRAIWGDKYDQYRVQTLEWVEQYQKAGTALGVIRQRSNKTGETIEFRNSGMIQFLGELTAFAAGEMDEDYFRETLEVRFHNNRILQILKDQRTDEHQFKTVLMTDSKGQGKPSTFPSDFPLKAWEWLSKPETGPQIDEK